MTFASGTWCHLSSIPRLFNEYYNLLALLTHVTRARPLLRTSEKCDVWSLVPWRKHRQAITLSNTLSASVCETPSSRRRPYQLANEIRGPIVSL